ncbi:hypothetical protein QQF64_001691 [Cirrhinus molitorella]|uniref:Uncharacterized protein n=1 Tax=Cirrhinus molitorella TaxID=172907 RepID=A0ABR3P0U8_9TELE
MPETPARGKFWEVSGDAEVKEPERGGVGWSRVCAPMRSSPGGHKLLSRVDFLPAGNPAHSLHPPPLTSPADAVRKATSPVRRRCGLQTRSHQGTLGLVTK